MPQVGTKERPLRVAIVGAGPAGFYTAEQLQRQSDLVIAIDIYERLPTPYGLVRYGVAPDHQKIKGVTKVFARIAGKPNVRFYGNVEFGRHVTVDDLRRYYHQIVYTVGSETDRDLRIPGADLDGSRAATEFVAWYNGHPDYRERQFDLTQERVAVIGVGNVAIDVARILCLTPEELAATDMADYAVAALSNSKVKEVVVVGRRGPAQAKFTVPEIKELSELAGADVQTLPEEVALDPLSQAWLDNEAPRDDARKVELLQGYAGSPRTGKPRLLSLRFLLSPTELVDDGHGRVGAMKLVRNELVGDDLSNLRSRPTGVTETMDVGLVFRSIGYNGVPLPGVPFDDWYGVIPNDRGRVLAGDSAATVRGEYTAGWIKRGPSGVIGTNKADAAETVEQMLADVADGNVLDPECPGVDDAFALVASRQPDFFTFADWEKLDAMEVERGIALGRPRVKFTDVGEMLAAVAK